MGIYKSFAAVYDRFMAETPYKKWVAFIEQVWSEKGVRPNLVLDLGCGTGNATQLLAAKGYDMIGVDLSEDMLMAARQKAIDSGLDILYLNQDMRAIELYGTVDACICLCDSINYITDDKDLLKVLKLIKNYLNPEGLFIFDMNTEFKFKSILGENTFAETDDKSAYIWENYYDEKQGINEYYMNFFTEDEKTGLYRRFEEIHYQKAYNIEFITSMLYQTGFEVLKIYDEENFEAPHNQSRKLFVVAKG